MPAKKSNFRRNALLVGAASIIILAVTVIFWPKNEVPNQISSRSTDDALASLLEEANADLDAGKAGEAAGKYRQALAINPKSGAAKSGIQTASRDLLKDAQADIKNGDEESAGDKLNDILANDPNNKEAQNKLKSIGKKTAWKPRNLDDPASTPFNVMPGALAGYKVIQRSWIRKPVVAGSVYVPKSPAVAHELDRVILTVAKLDDTSLSDKRYKFQKEMFPITALNLTVNNHPAYFALYNESHPEKFPILASLSWTRGKWFFSLDLMPNLDWEAKTQPSYEYKQGIALDIAKKLGY